MDGLAQDCSNSIANALELLQSCSKPSIYGSFKVSTVLYFNMWLQHCNNMQCFLSADTYKLMLLVSSLQTWEESAIKHSYHLARKQLCTFFPNVMPHKYFFVKLVQDNAYSVSIVDTDGLVL